MAPGPLMGSNAVHSSVTKSDNNRSTPDNEVHCRQSRPTSGEFGRTRRRPLANSAIGLSHTPLILGRRPKRKGPRSATSRDRPATQRGSERNRADPSVSYSRAPVVANARPCCCLCQSCRSYATLSAGVLDYDRRDQLAEDREKNDIVSNAKSNANENVLAAQRAISPLFRLVCVTKKDRSSCNRELAQELLSARDLLRAIHG